MNPLKLVVPLAFIFTLSACVTAAPYPGTVAYAPAPAPPPTPAVAAEPSNDQLQQLVAPIALYPDSLVAQILAASTYPDQVVVADRWLQANPGLNGDQLAQAVDQQPWDPSVKALTEFPSVLANMDKNLSWTSSLGDAYLNDQQGVMAAIQQMRLQARNAGELQSNSQQTVVQQGPSIVIQPVNPEVVYLPVYNPWIVYGAPIVPWPGWYAYPGLYWSRPGIAFSVGFGLGYFGGFGWGWRHWAPDWRQRTVVFNHYNYVSRNRVVVNHNYYANRPRTNAVRVGPSPGGAMRGGAYYGGARVRTPPPGTHGGAYGGYRQGGVVTSHAARGPTSMGGSRGGGRGGGGFHGGGHGGHR